MKKLKLKKKNLVILLVLLIFLISGVTFSVIKLTSKKTVVEDIPKIEEKPVEENKEEEKVIPEVQIVDLKSTSRPFAVMINNLNAARPYQIGLQDAYLVYEMIVEGGITRYLALFKDKTPDIVGPVRSSRHYYLDYALENDAYYVHWGWSPQAQSDISSLGINNINGLTYAQPYFFRKQYANIAIEHRAYASLAEISKLATQKYRSVANKDLLLNYSATNIEPNINGEEAINISLKFSNYVTTSYKYDEASNSYIQYVNNAEHIEYLTKEVIKAKNIIAYQVSNTSIVGDDKNRQELNNLGSGKGYFITGGKSYPITWSKSTRDSKTIYKYENGEEITVNDGTTWIHIVPTSGAISISN